jgi:alkyl hydroperoxide reductase subunit AhpC
VIPVLVDEHRTLSRQVKIFTNFWDGISSEQNMASVFIIDKDGILKFKYISQMTEDRPSVGYFLDFIKKMK